jgi:hypothetical protein
MMARRLTARTQHGAPDREVRAQLLRLDRIDSNLRSRWVATGFKDRALERQLDALSTTAIDWLREVIKRHGWPGRSLVGNSAADAASRLIQHADCSLAFLRRCLRLIKEAAARGDVPPRHVAYLTDVLRMRTGRKQLYGTKFRKRKGRLVPYPIEREHEVDERRKQMELEPLHAYARRLQRTYLLSADEAAMRSGPDWEKFVRRHWEKSPTHLTLGSPAVPAARALQSIIAASEPFRFGTRFRALPDVRFFVEDAQLRSPGKLLPGARERDVDRYIRRASASLGRKGFQLLVEQPLLLDFSLWNDVRGFIRGLLERVGVPVLPIVSELLVGNFARSPQGVAKRLHHSVLILVLHGRMRIRVWKKLWGDSLNETTGFDSHFSEATTLEASAGELLYVPSRAFHLEECREPCLALRLWIPARGARPTDAVKELLVKLMDRQLTNDHTVPYLEYPGRQGKGARAALEPLVRAAGAFEQAARSPDLLRALRIIWTRRVSACGLEPAPPPLELQPLEDSALVRGVPRSHVVRMQDSPGQWIWAVNGHVFPGSESLEAAQVLEALKSGAVLRVGELCQLARRKAQRTELRELLETLVALRGLELVPEGGA